MISYIYSNVYKQENALPRDPHFRDTMRTTAAPLFIPYNKRAIKNMWILCLVLLPLLVFLLLMLKFRDYPELFIISLTAVPLFIFLGIYLPVRLKSEKPAMIIDQLGILDNTGRNKGRFFLWNTVVKAEILKVKQARTLLIHVSNPQEVIGNENSWRKYKMEMSYRISGTPVEIACFNLDHDPEALAALINTQKERFSPNNIRYGKHI
jgi:hypothetical protein